MKEQVLTEIGLSTNEAKVYLALIEIGQCGATEIAKKTQLHRTNVYDAIKRLVERGLAAQIIIDGSKQYSASDPQALVSMLKEKESKLLNILPELQLSQKLATKGEAQVYEGVQAYCRILDELLVYKQPIINYGIPAQALEAVKHFITGFHNRRVGQKVVMKHIYNYEAKERIDYLNTLPYTEAKWISRDITSNMSTLVCGPEVTLTIWKNKSPVIIRIKNEDAAQSYREYFEILWQHAKK